MTIIDRRALLRLAAGAASASGLVKTAVAQTPTVSTVAKPAASAPPNPIVETASGKVRGFIHRGVWIFRGIPYGASTTGENRFMPPRKPEPWAGVRNCLNYGHWCPKGDAGVIENDHDSQNGEEDAFLLYRTGGWHQGEDCLRLNVWTPGPNPSGKKRAVMVYMHGGFYTGGGGNDLLAYDGENLARNHDVVVVTHNHRLNLFGFLNLAEVGGERYASSGNAGMLDNVAVLEWVRDNIANFGGDPGKVMIFGQSGGGGKVSTLMGMPLAKGLFHGVAVQSGSSLECGSAENSAKLAAIVLDELGISKTGIEKIHSVKASALKAVQAVAIRRFRGSARPDGWEWRPIVDGQLIPLNPAVSTLSARIPMLIGTCLNEFVSGCDNPERDTLTDQQLRERVTGLYKEKPDEIIAAYQREYPGAPPFGLWAAITSAGARQNAITQAERKAAQGGSAYQYIYAWRTPMLEGKPGTFHSAEIAFVFDNADLCTQYSGGGPEARALSSKMSAAWAAFARTGNPGHPDLPDWPAYTAAMRSTMLFDNQCGVRSDPEGEGLRLIRQVGNPSFF